MMKADEVTAGNRCVLIFSEQDCTILQTLNESFMIYHRFEGAIVAVGV